MADSRHRTRLAMAAISVVLLAGCATAGMGGGEMSIKGKAGQPVLFSWQSDNGGESGTMVATLPTATYSGDFFQITSRTQVDTLSPLWDGWAAGWNDWPFWQGRAIVPYNAELFVTQYSGKVLANLRNTSGQLMRCRLHLKDPPRGMTGGGEGECQIAGGTTINAEF